MVHIIPLVGAAALFAQTAFAAAVPARRTYNSGNSYNSNNYNNYNGGSQQEASNYGSNQYNSGSNQYQQSNQYENNNYGSNQYNNNNNYGSNQYNNNNNYGSNQYQQSQENSYTTTTEEMAMETSSEMMMEETSTTEMAMETSTTEMAMAMETSTEMAMETSTEMAMEMETTTSSSEYSWPSYGSGSVNNGGYNNCVQQCMAQFGAPPSTMTMESQESLPSASGAIHTILVAPEGAGLRYMPFAVNASVGDTIRYVWTTPNNHTATLSSALAICNKSGIAEQRNFVSGVKNAAQGMQIFDVTVETDQPQFFYCSVAQHCQKGMFGIINPGNSIGAPNTVGTMMSSLMQSNPELQAAYSYMIQNVTGTSAQNWGMGIPLDGVPESQYMEVAANVLFTQANFAANPGMLESGQGAHTPDGSPIQIVSGLNVLLSGAAATPSSAPSSHSSITPAATGSLTPVNATSGAMSARSVSTWVAVIVGVAGWLLI